ncbi:MAG: metal ABC transporter permease [Actinomycetia bacterium]|nr:metal ABC transporter permease [Actinomycetes bacterium]MCP5028609.1 metal ABC transporter permease [Actinomycetes bacterium]
MTKALLAGILTVVATSIVGTWVVLRGISFLGDALAHGVLPGIAIAFIIGVNTTVGALIAALVMVGGINLIRARSPLPEDTSIGILFVGFLALAVVIMSSRTGDLNRFLFGSITGVNNADLVRQAGAAAISVVGVVVFYRTFLVMTFDQIQARLLGLRPRLGHAVLLILLAISIVASFETVGTLLVFAFLVAPPATASLLVRRVPMIMTTALAIGIASVIVGLLISYHYQLAPGATMALVAVGCYLAALLGQAMMRSSTISTG